MGTKSTTAHCRDCARGMTSSAVFACVWGASVLFPLRYGRVLNSALDANTYLCPNHFRVLVRVICQIFGRENDDRRDGLCVVVDELLNIFGDLPGSK